MSELARLRRCARILRQAYPDQKFRVSLKYRTIFQVGYFVGLPCEFSTSLSGWEARVTEIEKAAS